MTATTTAAAPPAARTPGALLRPTLLGAVLAAAGVVLVHLLFDALGADFRVAPGGQAESTVVAPQAAGIAAGAVLVGGLAAAALARWTRRPATWFAALTGLALVAMAANPVMASDDTLTVVALELEHLVVAGAALALLLPALRTRR